MTTKTTFRFAEIDRDRLSTGMRVRIIGDTFYHPYTVVGIESRVESNGHRLYGGDVKAVIQTWSGRQRRVLRSQLVEHHLAWDAVDSYTAGRRVSYRAARVRTLAANTAAAKANRIYNRTAGLSSTVKVLRSTPSVSARESRTRCLASNRGINPEWLTALVNAVEV